MSLYRTIRQVPDPAQALNRCATQSAELVRSKREVEDSRRELEEQVGANTERGKKKEKKKLRATMFYNATPLFIFVFIFIFTCID